MTPLIVKSVSVRLHATGFNRPKIVRNDYSHIGIIVEIGQPEAQRFDAAGVFRYQHVTVQESLAGIAE